MLSGIPDDLGVIHNHLAIFDQNPLGSSVNFLNSAVMLPQPDCRLQNHEIRKRAGVVCCYYRLDSGLTSPDNVAAR